MKISLTAYDPSRYGRIDGKVESVSADAISDNQTGLQYYLVDISINGALYEDNGSEVITARNSCVNRCFGWQTHNFRLLLAANCQNKRQSTTRLIVRLALNLLH